MSNKFKIYILIIPLLFFGFLTYAQEISKTTTEVAKPIKGKFVKTSQLENITSSINYELFKTLREYHVQLLQEISNN